MANLERIYTIPLADAYEHVRTKRGKRAVKIVKEFALRHMKALDVRVSQGTNSLILRDGIQKPPRRIKVRLVKGDEGLVRIWLIGEEEKVKEMADKAKKDAEAREKAKKESKPKEAPAKKDAQKKEAAPPAKPPQSAAAPAVKPKEAALPQALASRPSSPQNPQQPAKK